MNPDKLREALLKHARNAFETASTIRDNERIEVYIDNGMAKISDILDENEEIIYSPNKILCYQIHGYDYLEEEIKTWIDYARVIPEQTEDTPLPEPTDMEKSIREMIEELAKARSVPSEQISSFEVFANLPVTLLGNIEQQIIEYWWNAKEEENAKILASQQIEEGLKQYAE